MPQTASAQHRLDPKDTLVNLGFLFGILQCYTSVGKSHIDVIFSFVFCGASTELSKHVVDPCDVT